MADTVDTTQPVASVPLPSADLINYRFDQADRQFEKLNKKLDDITASFATNAYVAELKSEGDKAHAVLQKQIDGIKSSARWWVVTIVAISTLAVGVIAIIK